MRVKRPAILVILLILLLWLILGITDYLRVKSFEMPIFSIGRAEYQDGGSGHYTGLGYSFDIKGNFMPEDELPGITEFTYYVFGLHIDSGIRD